ncbi:MAG: hypothetical protein QOI95_705 [Acidimicrobiaceae bacterium]
MASFRRLVLPAPACLAARFGTPFRARDLRADRHSALQVDRGIPAPADHLGPYSIRSVPAGPKTASDSMTAAGSADHSYWRIWRRLRRPSRQRSVSNREDTTTSSPSPAPSRTPSPSPQTTRTGTGRGSARRHSASTPRTTAALVRAPATPRAPRRSCSCDTRSRIGVQARAAAIIGSRTADHSHQAATRSGECSLRCRRN